MTTTATTTDTRSALDIARALLGHLAGWQLTADSVRHINEVDPIINQWAGIEEPATGAVVSLNVNTRTNRLGIVAAYIKGFEPWIDSKPFGHRGYHESITVALATPAARIAAEMKRRLLTPTYYERVAKGIEQRDACATEQTKTVTVAGELRAVLGATVKTVYGDREPTPDALRAIASYIGADGLNVEGSVHESGRRVRLKIDNLTANEARELLTLVRDWRDARPLKG